MNSQGWIHPLSGETPLGNFDANETTGSRDFASSYLPAFFNFRVLTLPYKGTYVLHRAVGVVGCCQAPEAAFREGASLQ